MAMQRQKGRQFENEVADSIREKLVAGGMDAREARTVAKARAKEIRSNLAALHEPDMVAGGWAAPAPTRMGDSVVNSSIGASWSSKLPAIDEMAANAIANGNGGAQLNIRLELLRGANN
jgi:filamentous hemagglutinin